MIRPTRQSGNSNCRQAGVIIVADHPLEHPDDIYITALQLVNREAGTPGTGSGGARSGSLDGPARRDGPSREWLDAPGGESDGWDGWDGRPGRRAVRLRTAVGGTWRRESAHTGLRVHPRDTPGRPPLVLEPDGRRSSFVGPRAGAGLDGDVRTTMVGTDYAKGPSTRWASSSSRTCAAIRLALGDQDLRLAQVADNLLRGITLSGQVV